MRNPRLTSFHISSEIVGETSDLRLDASFYNPAVAAAITALERSGMEIRPLGDIVNQVYIPPRFKRVYVDAEHGIPFIQGSHILQFQLTDLRHLSRTAHARLDRWIIKAGWILVTCSGTIGRVAIAPPQWDGWAASQHILRIVPNDDSDCPAGYLAMFLGSPLGQAQLTAQIYGAVVDELTEEQARSVQVPIPRTRAQRTKVKRIDELAMTDLRHRSEAAEALRQASEGLAKMLPSE
jgi:type I restriction enzyme S subunit